MVNLPPSTPTSSPKDITIVSPLPFPISTINPTQELMIKLTNGTPLILTLPYYLSSRPPRCRAEDLHFEDNYDESTEEYLKNNDSLEQDPEYDRLYRYVPLRAPVSQRSQNEPVVETGFPVPMVVEVQIQKITVDVEDNRGVSGEYVGGGRNGYGKKYQQPQRQQEHEQRLWARVKHSREEKRGHYQQHQEQQHQTQANSYNQSQTQTGPSNQVIHTPTPKYEAYQHAYGRH